MGRLGLGRLISAFGISLTLASCADRTGSEPPPEMGAVNELEPAPDAGAAPPADSDSAADACAAACSEGEVCCGGQCVDLRSDVEHCGETQPA